MSAPMIPPDSPSSFQNPLGRFWRSPQIIGVLRTPFHCVDEVPAQPYSSRWEGRVEIAARFQDGLQGLETFSHLILLYLFHQVKEPQLRVRSRIDGKTHGIFATREPQRPTPLGLSVVRLIRRAGGVLWVYGVDMLDQTPLIDLKPYVPAFDRRDQVRIGWMEGHVPRG